MEDLFNAVPERIRFPNLDLPRPSSTEMEIERKMVDLADTNVDLKRHLCWSFPAPLGRDVEVSLRRDDSWSLLARVMTIELFSRNQNRGASL